MKPIHGKIEEVFIPNEREITLTVLDKNGNRTLVVVEINRLTNPIPPDEWEQRRVR